MPFCGGPLHCAYYERKPRGGPVDLSEAFCICFSLCCGRQGCRRRTLPPSVRFWQRKVYWAPVVFLLSALRQGQHPMVTLQRLKAVFGVWRSTLKRWQRYFLKHFPQCIGYRRLAGRLVPPTDSTQLPTALLQRFYQQCGNAQQTLVNCLLALALGP